MYWNQDFVIIDFVCECVKGKGKIHPITGHEGPEGE